MLEDYGVHSESLHLRPTTMQALAACFGLLVKISYSTHVGLGVHH